MYSNVILSLPHRRVTHKHIYLMCIHVYHAASHSRQRTPGRMSVPFYIETSHTGNDRVREGGVDDAL